MNTDVSKLLKGYSIIENYFYSVNRELLKGNCSCGKQSNKTINLLVAGQTGAGKTTLVDSFINFMLGIELYDKFRYKLVDEKMSGTSQSF